MPDAILEEGIGETRLALIEYGRIVEAHVERASDTLRAGTIHTARLVRITGRSAIATIDGHEALIEPPPPGVTEGATFQAEVIREAIPEPGRPRLPKIQKASTLSPLSRLPSVTARFLDARRLLPHQPDALEAAGWSELLEEARTGIVAFDGGLLTIVLTPAMTVIDVDGALPPADLALAGATAAAEAIRRHGITGSVGIDLPTVGDKAVRTACAEAIDAVLPQPFERTAVNGFGFIQIVRRRVRPSLLERVQSAPIETAALQLLRRAERGPPGGVTLVAAQSVTGWLTANPALTEELARRIGGRVALRAEPSLAISAAYVAPLDL